MKLYVIRHGFTDCNKEHKYNCRFDEDINEIGIEQAKKASNKIKNLDIDFIICSPMKRTKHTMELVNVNKVSVIFDERLIERDAGKLTLTTIDMDNKEDYYYTEYYNYYSKNLVEGLESLPDLFARVHSFLDEIKEKYKNKNVLLVTHGAVAKAIQFYFEKMPKDGMLLKASRWDNCEIKEFEL